VRRRFSIAARAFSPLRADMCASRLGLYHVSLPEAVRPSRGIVMGFAPHARHPESKERQNP